MLTDGRAMMTQFTAIFTREPVIRAIMGRRSFPEACRIAFSIRTMQTKKDARPMIRSRPGPAGWLFGYSTFTIGKARAASPTPIGMEMTEAMRMASSAVFSASPLFPFAMAPATAGTMAMVSGVIKAAGRLKSVCTLP